MMEATFGLTALCDTENGFPLLFALETDKDGCATETNLPDDDDDDEDAPSLDLDPNMLAYLAAREVVFGDDDVPDDDDAFGKVDPRCASTKSRPAYKD